jgi:hypothetical protein
VLVCARRPSLFALLRASRAPAAGSSPRECSVLVIPRRRAIRVPSLAIMTRYVPYPECHQGGGLLRRPPFMSDSSPCGFAAGHRSSGSYWSPITICISHTCTTPVTRCTSYPPVPVPSGALADTALPSPSAPRPFLLGPPRADGCPTARELSTA